MTNKFKRPYRYYYGDVIRAYIGNANEVPQSSENIIDKIKVYTLHQFNHNGINGVNFSFKLEPHNNGLLLNGVRPHLKVARYIKNIFIPFAKGTEQILFTKGFENLMLALIDNIYHCKTVKDHKPVKINFKGGGLNKVQMKPITVRKRPPYQKPRITEDKPSSEIVFKKKLITSDFIVEINNRLNEGEVVKMITDFKGYKKIARKWEEPNLLMMSKKTYERQYGNKQIF